MGGVEYSTTKATLCTYPDSMLAKMFDGDLPSTKDEDGRVIIDRDGELFGYILNFLRSSKLALPKDFKKIDQLGLEADFFQIEQLTETIDKIKATPAAVRVYYHETVAGRAPERHEFVEASVTGVPEVLDCLKFPATTFPYWGTLSDTADRFREHVGGYKTKIHKLEKLGYSNDDHKQRNRATLPHAGVIRYRFCLKDYMKGHGWECESRKLK